MEQDTDDFEDYLSEFKTPILFDSETCPVCGIKVSDTLSVSNSPYVDLIQISEEEEEEEVNSLCEEFIKNKIEFKVYKEIDNSSLESIKYRFRIVVMMKDLDKANELIKAVSK